jgi:hypothetical protein
MIDFSSPGWRWGDYPEARIRALLNPAPKSSPTPTPKEFSHPEHFFSKGDAPRLCDNQSPGISEDTRGGNVKGDFRGSDDGKTIISEDEIGQ